MRRWRGGTGITARGYYKGGFESKMNRREAALILEVPYVSIPLGVYHKSPQIRSYHRCGLWISLRFQKCLGDSSARIVWDWICVGRFSWRRTSEEKGALSG